REKRASRAASAAPRLACFYSASVAWFCSAVDTPVSPTIAYSHFTLRPARSKPGSKPAKHSRLVRTKGMAARKNAIREARAASQAFASARKQLIEATALQRDTIAAAANEYSANQLWRRAVAAITT
ncbi:hypothetical protein, partial [Nitrobacter vulgaris]|uniref:hypothetical protein n=1 Tax=Nitrobacter vulgaris TaxID=29421 RepID=UPI00286C0551